MPAFVGGKVHLSGIKWLVSFPDNIIVTDFVERRQIFNKGLKKRTLIQLQM